MVIECTDPDSRRLVADTNLQDKGTQDAHKTVRDCNVETGTGHVDDDDDDDADDEDGVGGGGDDECS